MFRKNSPRAPRTTQGSTTHILRLLLLASAGIFLGDRAAFPAPKPAAHHAAGHAEHHSTRGRNPHLHSFVVDDDRHHFHDHHLHEHWWLHHWYYVGGDYTAWYADHVGLGILQGTVVGSNGAGVPYAQVWLRHSNGRAFKRRSRKHTTHTDSLGNFVMLGVQPGHYVIMAKTATTEKRAPIEAVPGVTVRSNIQF